MELELQEMVPNVGQRSEFGRVVVSTKTGPVLRRQTLRFKMCCNRAFLTDQSYQKHIEEKQDHFSPNLEKLRNLNLPPPLHGTGGQNVENESDIAEEDNSEIGSRPLSGWVLCDLCHVYKTQYRANLTVHKNKAHTLEPDKGFSCDHCSCVYPTQAGKTLHIRTWHQNMSMTNNQSDSTQYDDYKPNVFVPLEQEIDNNYRIPDGETGESISDSDQLQGSCSSGTARQMLFACNKCAWYKSFSKSDVKKHKKIAHTQNGKYPTHRLSISSTVNSEGKGSYGNKQDRAIFTANWVEDAVNQHDDDEDEGDNFVEETLNEDTEFRCAFCPSTFSNKLSLIKHNSITHSKAKSKAKGDRSGDHQSQSHSNDSHTKCFLCNRDFANSYSLLIHNSDYHVEGGAFPCLVDGCKCVCRDKQSLQNHKQICHPQNSNSIRYEISKIAKSHIETVDSGIAEQELDISDPDEVNSGVDIPYENEIDNDEENESVYNCDICEFVAHDAGELSQHLKFSHVICGVECICGCSFSTATELTNHKQTCSKFPKPAQLSTHKTSPLSTNKVSPKPLVLTTIPSEKCPICARTFEDRVAYRKHKRLGKCSASQTASEEMNEEMSVEADETVLTSKSTEENIKADIPQVCPHCNKTFKNDIGLRVHLNLAHTDKDAFITENFKRCEICNYRTNNYYGYRIHKKSCHVDDGIDCPECPCSFRKIGGLAMHYKLVHKRKLDVDGILKKCHECDYTTFRESNLQRHEKNGHNIKVKALPLEKPNLKCDLCDYTANCTSSLNRHRLSNHVEEGFACELCNNSFSTEAGRRSHVGIIHSVYEQKQTLQCHQCEFTTNSSPTLEIHLLKNHVENGHKCHICNNSFATEGGLRGHLKNKHKTTVGFTHCEICNYKTGNIKNYTRHKMTCHVAGGVQCPECVCQLRNVDSLSQHVKQLHKGLRFNKNDYILKCEICDFKAYYTDTIKRHTKVAHPSSASNVNSNTTESTKCPICDAIISEKMEDHFARAHVQDGHACSDCKCSFATPIGLSRHYLVRHGKKLKKKERDPTVYIVPCTRCSFRAITLQGLSVHCIKKHGFLIPIPKFPKIRISKRQCNMCNLEFSGTFAAHQRRYHVENGFKCTHCSCAFETAHSRAIHMKKEHNTLPTKRCNLCRLIFIGPIKRHMKLYHSENGHECEYCSCSFETENGRAIHLRKIHNVLSAKKLQTCGLCGFKITERMEQHLERCHVKGGIKCKFCSCSFESDQGCLRHMKIRHNASESITKKCEKCGIIPVISLSAHLARSHVENGYPCTHCCCSFETERIKISHLERYHNIKTVRNCSICGLIIRGSLQEHMDRLHVKNGFNCRFCKVSLKTEQGRTFHMIKMHRQQIADDPNFNRSSCQLCGLKITGSLKDHILRNHASINNFKCHKCTCRFSTNLGRSRHMLSVHKVQISKKLVRLPPMTKLIQKEKCNLCGMTTYGKSSLKDHMRRNHVQNGFPCAHCPCKFSSESGRSSHERCIHSQTAEVTTDNPRTSDCGNDKHEEADDIQMDELPSTSHHQQTLDESPLQTLTSLPKPSTTIKVESPLPKEKLTCPDCGYLATCISHLKMHMQKSHVKNSPFICRHCTCSFASGHELDRHIRILHPDTLQHP